MKKITFLAAFLILTSVLLAQRTYFSLNSNVESMIAPSTTSDQSYELTSYRALTATQSLRETILSENVQKLNYTPKLGFSLVGTIQRPIGNNLQWSTGLGLLYSNVSYETEFVSFKSTLLMTDTVPTPQPVQPLCDSYTNTFDPTAFTEGTRFEILHLMIPLNVEYRLLEGKLTVSAGTFLQTPLYSKEAYSSTFLEMEQVNGLTECSYLTNEIADKSGNGLHNLVFGFSGGLRYKAYKNWDVALGFRQITNNVFVKDGGFNIFGQSSGQVLNPSFWSLGLAYTFAKTEKE